jgi:uncharacterized protein (DUF2252 family)
MATSSRKRPAQRAEERTERIVEVLGDAFAPLMSADPAAFRGKYRKMARDPHAFYRGTACLFYADVADADGAPEDTGADWVDERSGRIWIHGDLHVENFGTYLDADGRLVFDVNDFDEAYLGRWTWDLQRFAASLALVGWQKALPEDALRSLVAAYVGAYLDQVDAYVATEDDSGDFALRLDTTDGPIHDVLVQARQMRRADLLESQTQGHGERMFREDASVRRLGVEEQSSVVEAYRRYLGTIPGDRRRGELFYELRDVVGKSGFGIGSAGLPAYSLLIEGHSQALDNDVVLSMKQANVPAVSRFVDTSDVESYFEHEGHRTVVSQRALQAHTDPLLGWTEIGGTGYVVSEVSPYELDLSWEDLVEPDQIAQVVAHLGRATAKVHCASDTDSDQDLVDFQVEEAVTASIGERREELVAWVVDFGLRYAEQVRTDHALFVEAFRSGRIGVAATG